MYQIEKIDEMDYEDSNLYVKRNFIPVFNKIGIFTIAKKPFKYENKTFSEKVISKGSRSRKSNSALKPGDVVIVRPKGEILETLDEEGMLDSCLFSDEMWQYCDTQQKVFKRVRYFDAEGGKGFFRVRNVVLLDGVHCSGKLSFSNRKCDRSCLLFWKEDWLEKIK